MIIVILMLYYYVLLYICSVRLITEFFIFTLLNFSQLFDAGDVFIMTPRSDGWKVFVRTREGLSASSPKWYAQEREWV